MSQKSRGDEAQDRIASGESAASVFEDLSLDEIREFSEILRIQRLVVSSASLLSEDDIDRLWPAVSDNVDKQIPVPVDGSEELPDVLVAEIEGFLKARGASHLDYRAVEDDDSEIDQYKAAAD